MSLTRRSLADLVGTVQAGEASAREVVEAHVTRSEELQPELNAYTLLDGERALDRAAMLDEQAARNEQPGALTGAPLGVKDLLDHQGRVTTCGSSFYRRTPDESAPAVDRLEDAGAVVVGRTGLHEFAFGFSSENHWWGPVRNPWDPTTSPGGSSGGSAAAVAAGLVAGALGTDTGGSVRVPAAMCGVFGLKVTHGRVPVRGVFPLAPSLDTVGPIARSTADVALIYREIAGDDPDDPWAAPVAVDEGGRPIDLGSLRIGVPVPWTDEPTDPSIGAAFTGVLDSLADLRAQVERVHIPELDPPGMIEASVYPEIAAIHRAWFEEKPDEYGPEVAARLETALALSLDDYAAGREWRSRVRNAAARALNGVDVLLTPAVAASRKEIGRKTVRVGSSEVGYQRALSIFTALVNHMGNPALVVPLAADGDPPPSLQIIGRAWSEHHLIEIGMGLEAQGLAAFRPPPTW